ncbi:MAG: metallophosphoesterase family protein [Acidobacteriaceae bacterium]
MRVAVLSDIHGNLTAFEALQADLRQTSPDLILHGGDLADSGSSPTEIVDRIRELGWQGVMGNTDEMLILPDALEEFASLSTARAAMWELIRQIASATRSALGDERLSWLRNLPRVHLQEDFALVHASPQSCWRVPVSNATDADVATIYGALDRPMVIFAHTHVPSIRSIAGGPQLLINTGSVGLPHGGDPRASYLLLDDGRPSIRRVEYDVAKELQSLSSSDLPGAAWTSRILRTSSPQMP